MSIFKIHFYIFLLLFSALINSECIAHACEQIEPSLSSIIAEGFSIVAQNHPLVATCICYALIKYIILDKLLSSLLYYFPQRTFLCSILYYLGARANPQLLRWACMEKNSDLAFRCLRYGANPKKANYRE